MDLGIFTRTWTNLSVSEAFKEMRKVNLHKTQFKMSCVGYPTIPSSYENSVIDKIKEESKNNKVDILAISGTFNLVDPNEKRLHENIKHFKILCQIANELNVPIITLCTGTKDRENMWKFHQDNNTQQVWKEMCHNLKKIIKYAEKYNIILGIEPEVSNVVNSALKARKLLDHMQSKYLKIIMDGANLFEPGKEPKTKEVLKEAFSLLGNDIVLVHAKDFIYQGDISYAAPGKGILNYDLYISLLKKHNYDGTLIMHGLLPDEICESIRFLKDKI